MEDKKILLEKVGKYIDEIKFGKIVLSIHQGDVVYIEKQEKEKLDR